MANHAVGAGAENRVERPVLGHFGGQQLGHEQPHLIRRNRVPQAHIDPPPLLKAAAAIDTDHFPLQ
ncbi:MAG: hypothetical protein MUF06_22210, partial [Pirellulaceae bacterium]|nr:hypothetical protein [Pirellulaceae bacterium]